MLNSYSSRTAPPSIRTISHIHNHDSDNDQELEIPTYLISLYPPSPSFSYLKRFSRMSAVSSLYSLPPPSIANSTTTTLCLSPHIFPSSFGIYHAPGTQSDMVIAHSASEAATNPLFYISTSTSTSGQDSGSPDITLYSGNLPCSAPLATAKFCDFYGTLEIEIFASSIPGTNTGAGTPLTGIPGQNDSDTEFDNDAQIQIQTLPTKSKLTPEKLSHPTSHPTYSLLLPSSSLSSPFSPSLPPNSHSFEKYEWKPSHGPEVRSLKGGKNGMKLVRTVSNEVVAVWAPPGRSWGGRKRGKIGFVIQERGMRDGSGKIMGMGRRDVRDELGGSWEVGVVVSVLGLVGRGRRGKA